MQSFQKREVLSYQAFMVLEKAPIHRDDMVLVKFSQSITRTIIEDRVKDLQVLQVKLSSNNYKTKLK